MEYCYLREKFSVIGIMQESSQQNCFNLNKNNQYVKKSCTDARALKAIINIHRKTKIPYYLLNKDHF